MPRINEVVEKVTIGVPTTARYGIEVPIIEPVMIGCRAVEVTPTESWSVRPTVFNPKKTGGGRFDRTDTNIYFLASNPRTLEQAVSYSKYLLVAVNELRNESDEGIFRNKMMSDPHAVVFLDSGVFNLASQHAAKHGITHDEALRTPLDKLDGFDVLRERYIRLVKQYEHNLWGYVEIDLGGKDQKRITRAGLEAEGLQPIPVYHPLNDGWDYFDELASSYDRICVGNIVQASRYVRLRIMATIFERKKKYPHLWIHLLGMTPNEWANAFPVESMDSSTWLAAVRWPDAWRERATNRPFTEIPRGYVYKYEDLESWSKGIQLVAAQAYMNNLNWRARTAATGEKP